MVQFNGHFDGTAITPDEQVEIPINIPLRVTIEPASTSQLPPVDWQRLLDLATDCTLQGPDDLAQRHDHYAHGKPVE
jgi:hypothetical protein